MHAFYLVDKFQTRHFITFLYFLFRGSNRIKMAAVCQNIKFLSVLLFAEENHIRWFETGIYLRVSGSIQMTPDCWLKKYGYRKHLKKRADCRIVIGLGDSVQN